MKRADRNAVIQIPLVVLAAGLLAWAGGRNNLSGPVPVFAICIGLAFVIQWIAFIPAFLLQSERFFDVTGSVSYIAVAAVGLFASRDVDTRGLLLFALVAIWAIRLGAFLFRRVHRVGKDGRFDELKPSFVRFFMVWTLQGLWISFTLAAALAAMTAGVHKEWGWISWIGLFVWGVGFLLEAVADAQKSHFRMNPIHRGHFIQTGLWSWSRHPNYFGEIVLWIGVAIIAAPVLRGWAWMTLVSPLFVALLLTRVSGIPMLEKRSDEKWGGQTAYESYKKRTAMLVPRPPRRDM
ncbi:DUF1295 domain-containing protein [Candidatus Bipolaricaulota bacterium]|nr:DUF1295 domain-containing protein [Candidatus Bipolaricaulota bacterium]